jgi:hypothetical protein
VVVDLGNDVEGFIARNQIEIPANENIDNYVREGVNIPLRVTEFDLANRRIALTPTAPLERQPGEAPPRVQPGEPSGDEAAASGGDVAAAPARTEGTEERQPADEGMPASTEQA